MVEVCHYAHRPAPCSVAVGLFDKLDGPRLIGVITYGGAANQTLRTGVCGPSEMNNVIELSRLWVEDGTPVYECVDRNGKARATSVESFFISRSFHFVDKEIIVAYADPGATNLAFQSKQPHLGIIYQATNWIYTGQGIPFKDPYLKNRPELHHTSIPSECRDKKTIPGVIICLGCKQHFNAKPKKGEPRFSLKKALEEIFPGQVEWRDRARKHRYVHFNNGKNLRLSEWRRRRGELEAKLRYPNLPYPKA